MAAVSEDLLYYVQIAVQLHACREGPSSRRDWQGREPQVHKAHDVSGMRGFDGFGLSDGVGCPVQIDAPEVGVLRRERYRRLLRFVENLHLRIGIDFRLQ